MQGSLRPARTHVAQQRATSDRSNPHTLRPPRPGAQGCAARAVTSTPAPPLDDIQLDDLFLIPPSASTPPSRPPQPPAGTPGRARRQSPDQPPESGGTNINTSGTASSPPPETAADAPAPRARAAARPWQQARYTAVRPKRPDPPAPSRQAGDGRRGWLQALDEDEEVVVAQVQRQRAAAAAAAAARRAAAAEEEAAAVARRQASEAAAQASGRSDLFISWEQLSATSAQPQQQQQQQQHRPEAAPPSAPLAPRAPPISVAAPSNLQHLPPSQSGTRERPAAAGQAPSPPAGALAAADAAAAAAGAPLQQPQQQQRQRRQLAVAPDPALDTLVQSGRVRRDQRVRQEGQGQLWSVAFQDDEQDLADRRSSSRSTSTSGHSRGSSSSSSSSSSRRGSQVGDPPVSAVSGGSGLVSSTRRPRDVSNLRRISRFEQDIQAATDAAWEQEQQEQQELQRLRRRPGAADAAAAQSGSLDEVLEPLSRPAGAAAAAGSAAPAVGASAAVANLRRSAADARAAGDAALEGFANITPVIEPDVRLDDVLPHRSDSTSASKATFPQPAPGPGTARRATPPSSAAVPISNAPPDSLAVADSDWQQHAARWLPGVFDPTWHVRPFEFLLDLWPAVEDAHNDGDDATLRRCYGLLAGFLRSRSPGMADLAGASLIGNALDEDGVLLQGCAAWLPLPLLEKEVLPLVQLAVPAAYGQLLAAVQGHHPEVQPAKRIRRSVTRLLQKLQRMREVHPEVDVELLAAIQDQHS